MKNIFLIIAFIQILTIQAKKTDFKSHFKKLEKVLLFDEFYPDNELVTIPYDKIKVFTIYDNQPYIDIKSEFESLHKFYAIGSIDLEGQHKGYIVFHTAEMYKDRYLYLIIFDKENNFTDFKTIGIRGYTNSVLNKNTLIFPSGRIYIILDNLKSIWNIKLEDSYYSKKQYFEEMNVSLDILKEELNNYLFQFNDGITINTDFFKKNKLLIPIIYKGYHRSNSLSNIYGKKINYSETYYLYSKKFQDKQILITYNRYKSTELDYYVADVSYIILDSENKLIANDRIGHIYINNKTNEIISLGKGEVYIKNKVLYIKNEFDKIQKFKF